MRRILILALLVVPLSLFAQDARSELDLGVQDYKNARYQEAIEHFQRATELDPTMLNARLYLATAFAQQYIPGAETPDNVGYATKAVAEYKKVLELDPRNINSMKGIAYLYLWMKKFEDSKGYYAKAADADPNDPENYYSIGVISWTEVYEPMMKLHAELHTDTLIYLPQCGYFRSQNQERVERGIEALNNALKLRPDYDDAMAYMNLLYRERADIQCGDSAASEADLKLADEWVDKTMAIKKAKAEKEKQDGAKPTPEQ